ncbi:hypothetical protein ACG7TL_006688 [Trametes sanguinea]
MSSANAPEMPLPPGQRWCNCWKYCKAVWRAIPDWKYRRHARYRAGVADFFGEAQAEQDLDVPNSGGQAHDTSSSSSSDDDDADEDADNEVNADGLEGRDDSGGGTLDAAGVETSGAPGTAAVDAEANDPHMPPSPAQSPTNHPSSSRAAGLEDPSPVIAVDGDAPEPEHGYSEDVDVPRQARQREVREVQAFIQGLQEASLEASQLHPDTVERLRNPREGVPVVLPGERAGLRMFLARGDSSEANYEDNRAAMLELHPEDDIPTYDQVKDLVAGITGVHAVRTDMCVNTCILG